MSSIQALVDRYALDGGQAEQLEQLAQALAADPEAPTTVRAPRRIAEDHLADSLVVLEVVDVPDGAEIADLGSGAGLPGLPLAIARPAAHVWLVESSGRKCRFLERLITATGVENATVVCARAEAWIDGQERCDIVLARAVARLDIVAEYAAPLLRVGGTLLAWRGRRDPADEAAAARAAEILGLDVGDPVWVEPYPGAVHRHLQAVRKLTPTPARFPRRPGMARKRPLGGGPSDRSRR